MTHITDFIIHVPKIFVPVHRALGQPEPIANPNLQLLFSLLLLLNASNSFNQLLTSCYITLSYTKL